MEGCSKEKEHKSEKLLLRFGLDSRDRQTKTFVDLSEQDGSDVASIE